MNRVEKDWTELDFAKVDFESNNWSWNCGGSPLDDDEYGISHHSDMVETRYKLPPCLSYMLRKQELYGAESAKLAIKNAIGCR